MPREFGRVSSLQPLHTTMISNGPDSADINCSEEAADDFGLIVGRDDDAGNATGRSGRRVGLHWICHVRHVE